MHEVYDVLIESVIATWHEDLGTARLPSSATLAGIVGFQRPIAANNSVGTFAFVVDNNLAAEIVEVAFVLGLTLTAVHQI